LPPSLGRSGIERQTTPLCWLHRLRPRGRDDPPPILGGRAQRLHAVADVTGLRRLLPPCCYRKSSTGRKCSNISWEHFLAREDPDALAEALAMMFALRLTGHSAVRGEDHLELGAARGRSGKRLAV